jgi:hypothetical protein
LDFVNSVAAGFGTNSEELLKFAKDGRLTAESFIQALERVKNQTDATFGLTQSTIGEATGSAKDALGLLAGKFFETTDAGATLTATIGGAAAEIRELANDSGKMESAGQSTLSFFEDVIQRGRVLLRVVQEAGTALISLANASPAAILARIASGQGIGEAIESSFGPLREQIKALPTFVDELSQLAAAPIFTRATATPAAPSSTPGPTGPAPALAPGKAAAADLERQAKATNDAVDAFNRLRASQDPLIAAGQTFAEEVRILNEAMATGKVSADSHAAGLQSATDALIAAPTKQAIEDFIALQEQLDPLIALENAHANALAVIAAAAASGRVPVEELAAANEKLDASFNKAREDLEQQNRGPLFDVVTKSANRALDSIVEFTTTGQGSIKEFARSVVADLQKVILKLLVVRALEAAGGGIKGGVGSALTSLAGSLGGARADGGPSAPARPSWLASAGPSCSCRRRAARSSRTRRSAAGPRSTSAWST